MFFLKTSLFLIPLLLSGLVLAQEKRMVILGDSLTEGYGVPRESAYPALLEKKLNEAKLQGQRWKVVNAGVSGSTSASGLSRLQWQLKSKPDVLIVALGANDGLRGTSPASTKKNLKDVVELAQKNKISVILAGLLMPPNYGPGFTKDFGAIFPAVARETKVPLIPFILEGVAGDPTKNLADGIHPNEKGHEIMADLVFRFLQGVLK